jgi:hypothetical protein
MSMWFSTQCLKSFSAPKCFKHVFQITFVNPCWIYFGLRCQAASPSVHQNCAMEDSHGMCIAFWVTYFVWQEPPPGDEAWSTQPNDCQLLCFNFSFRFHLTLQHHLDQQRLAHQTKWLGT